MKKRIISTLVSLAMVLSMVLFLFQPVIARAEESSSSVQFDSIINLEDVPEGFHPEDTGNPYGTGLNEPFLMVEQNELLLYQSYNRNDKDGRLWTTAYDNYKPGSITNRLASGTMDLGHTTEADKGGFDSYNKYDNNAVHSYVEAVAFDPTGSGRKDHVAYIGYRAEDEEKEHITNVVVWVQNTRTGSVSAPYVIGQSKWMEDRKVNQYQATNFLAITAGSYNGDAKETLVCYAPLNGTNYGMTQLSYDGSAVSAIDGMSKNFLHKKYRSEEGNEIANKENHAGNKLGVDLDTGDINGDGIDDLVTLSYVNKPEGKTKAGINFDKLDSYYYVPYLYVTYGGGGGHLFESAFSQVTLESVGEADDKGVRTYSTMAFPGVSCGDIDGDGKDEVVAAGFKNTVKSQENGSSSADKAFDVKNDLLVVAAYSYNKEEKNIGRVFFDETKSNEWTKGGSSTSDLGKYGMMQEIVVECVAINGQTSAEAVFINGGLYQVNKSSGKIQSLLEPEYFKEKDDAEGGRTINRTYLHSAVSGNFDGNDAGREQIAFSFGLKQESARDYAFKLGIIGGQGYSDLGEATDYYSNNIDKGKYAFTNKGDAYKQKLNCVLVAIDNDNDGVLAKYVGKNYAYADPDVKAVLQAAPYFGELGSYDDFDDGGTGYSVSTTYGFGTEATTEKSFGIGTDIEVAGPSVKVGLESGYLASWSTSFEENLDTTYSTEFTAGAENTVVLERTPVFIYNYAICKEGKWPDMSSAQAAKYYNENCIQVSIPNEPRYYTMTVDSYNDFVEYYNNNAKTKPQSSEIALLKPLDDPYLTDNIGNPWGYRENWDGAKDESGVQKLSGLPYTLSHSGTAISSSWEQSSGTSTTVSSTDGFHFGLTVQGGGMFAFGEAWAGVSTSCDYSTGYGVSTSEAKSKGTNGTVAPLSSQKRYEDYKFSWSFGKWEKDLGGPNGDAPIFGYCINPNTISAPTAPVRDLTVSCNNEDTGEFLFEWSDPNDDPINAGRVPNEGFYLYQVIDGQYVRLTKNPLPKGTTSHTMLVGNAGSGNVYTFAVTPLANTEQSGWQESDYSNEVVYVRGKDGKSAYEIAVLQGFVGTEGEWIASLAGENGGVKSMEKTATNGNIDTYTITFTNGDTTTFTVTNGVDGTDGTDGADGTDGREIQLRAEEGVLQWQYKGETEWNDLLKLDGTEVTIAGQKGDDGREIELRKDTTAGVIQWRYIGEDDTAWVNLISLKELTGDDARDVEFRMSDDFLQWRYVPQEAKWTDYGVPADFIDAYDGVSAVTYRVFEEHIQWKYSDGGEDTWADVIQISKLTGDENSVIEVRAGDAYLLQWCPVMQEEEWTDLIASSELKGSAVELQVKDDEIQWRYHDEDDWRSLLPLSEVQGIPGIQGETGKTGEAGRGIASIEKTDSQNGADIYTITYTDGEITTFSVTNGTDGKDGKDGKDGIQGPFGATGAKGGKGERGSFGLDGKDGADGGQGIQGVKGDSGNSGLNGKDGTSSPDIQSVQKTDSKDDVDTYSVTLSDGTSHDFTITNSKDETDIASVKINDAGDLVITMSNGSEINAGSVMTVAQASGDGVQETAANKGIYGLLGLLGLLGNAGWIVPLLKKRKEEE